ncbi:MAG TPA: UDP-N-acetylglucosamine 2-epimerase (non-hydrolyzing) [Desulfobacteraceae bacterium]|nr:UDP-N-acetylglucosamine 2-epimerase (non-hydrolyzing) [Desulfobacteraceae bacterium]HPJ67657.1 UDP-N-acetylglucosamine 2-epimerase (non-hydrolyzing) [Desulfobacteraceae bacterium]HPQ27789.1 UDP-N-acetylglucosamine 2-epimerase (non-hydrolyzing) [Desulfobacteraceae bacterium]
MKITTIIGARPQFIKAAMISHAIAAHNQLVGYAQIEEIILHTGQHYDDHMSAIFFRELDIPEPKYNLGIGSASHGRQTGQMLMAIEEVLLKERPDWVLIYGDTNSTLAGALAASKLHIRIAHVEAGLRSFNRLMPEEINRVVSDQLSHLLLCPSQVAIDNLAAEGITKGVSITGDVMAGALQFAATRASVHSDILASLGLRPQGYIFATVHRAENTDNSQRLENIVSAFASLNEPVIFPVHPRTRKFLKERGYKLSENVTLMDPVSYFDSVALETSARFLLTDSGGMQKEAYWLKVPCITMRDETEWVETVESGWNVLAGADHDRIVNAVRTFTAPMEHLPLYGDSESAARCLHALLESCE